MGIKGLLPYLKSITKEVSLASIRGCTVGVDTYCWLHKAAISCSDKIALGEDTDIYLNYCLRLIKLLLVYDIKVILVFDGKNLPAKLNIENKRQQNRDNFRNKGLQFTLERKTSEAKECFDKCVEISHKLAVNLIKAAHSLGVKCIVAPYEADAQLAYLGKNHIVDYVITEDSDLLLFGTPKVLFKLDFSGRANLIEINDLNKVLKFPLEKYSYNKFRYVCIISGCDYFPGLNGVGIITAVKMIQKTQSISLKEFLTRINIYSNTKIVVSKEEITQAVQADLTFQYQIVFDPISCQQVPLNNYAVDIDSSDLHFAGEIIKGKELVIQLALGKRDPTSHELMGNYNLKYTIQESIALFNFNILKENNLSLTTREKNIINIPSTKEKNLKVVCQFPWKDASKENDKKMDFDEIVKFYSVTDEEITERKSKENVLENTEEEEVATLLNNLLSKEGNLTKSESEKEIVSYPFTGNSIIRSKRRISDITCFKENKTPVKSNETNKRAKTIIIGNRSSSLVSKKELVQSKLSHLIKKKEKD